MSDHNSRAGPKMRSQQVVDLLTHPLPKHVGVSLGEKPSNELVTDERKAFDEDAACRLDIPRILDATLDRLLLCGDFSEDISLGDVCPIGYFEEQSGLE
ncbi:hypothetical protein BGK72_24700 [Streptomyces agglomeratus]|nr:hypothetical protein BGK72_24700 [Streptomyces agglomeratus]